MTTQTASGIDIFVVDDEPVIAHTLGLILSRVGYCVHVFNDPFTARLHLHHSPRLLISDHHMPGLTGSNLASIIAEEAPRTKVLLLSANLVPTDPAWQAVEREVRDARLIAKPLLPAHLLTHVKEMIGPPFVEEIYPKSGHPLLMLSSLGIRSVIGEKPSQPGESVSDTSPLESLSESKSYPISSRNAIRLEKLSEMCGSGL